MYSGACVKLFAVLFREVGFNFGEHIGLRFAWPLIPWIAVISLGYLIGALYTMDGERRRRILTRAGWAMLAAFLTLRVVNVYGDPGPWSVQERGPAFTMLSFLSTEKYPPSLQFLLITLGPCFLFLAWFEKARGKIADFFIAFGRVPLFFYLVHAPSASLVAILWPLIVYGSMGWPLSLDEWPAAYESNLFLVYAVTILLSSALLPVCRWFWRVKKTRRHWWLSYL